MGVTLASPRALRALRLGLLLACLPLAGAAAAQAQREVLEGAAPAADTLRPQPAPAPGPAASTAPPAAAADTGRTAPADTNRTAAPPDSASRPAPAGPPAPKAAAPADSAEETVITAAPEAGGGPGDLTIEVDEARSRNEGKSLPLALLASAALPGAGELYLSERKKAKTFLLLEAGFWASLYVAWVSRDSYLQSARNLASEHAGIDASGKDENFLETMEAYRSYQEKQHRQDSYELAQVLSGKREQDYDIKPEPGNYWDFGSSANPANTDAWRDFQGSMRYYRASKVALSFALGALALNRLASMVNTLQAYKRTSARSASLEVIPDLGPDHAGTRLTVRF